MDQKTKNGLVSLIDFKEDLSMKSLFICQKTSDNKTGLLGLLFLKDQLKLQSDQVLPLLQKNQINVVIVTGDGSRCAYNQARECLLLQETLEEAEKKQLVISGQTIRKAWEARE